MSASERGAVKGWIIAFVATAGIGLGAFIGIGCLVGANTCPGSSAPKQETLDGMTLYLTNCAACHGRDGTGIRGVPSLVTGTPGALDAQALAPKIERGKPLAGMPRFRGTLSPEQIRAVAEYVVSLRGSP